MKATSRTLIALGSVVILYALFMDTTVTSGYGRVHNIGLEADHQLFLIFGCFSVLVGVVLFAVRTLKQSPAQDAAEVEARRAAVASASAAASRTAQQVSAKTTIYGNALLAPINAKLRKARADNIVGRLLVGGFVALCTAPMSDHLLTWWLLPVVVLLYSLRDRPAFDVMRSMLGFNLAWTLLHAVWFGILIFRRRYGDISFWEVYKYGGVMDAIYVVAMTVPVALGLFCALVSVVRFSISAGDSRVRAHRGGYGSVRDALAEKYGTPYSIEAETLKPAQPGPRSVTVRRTGAQAVVSVRGFGVACRIPTRRPHRLGRPAVSRLAAWKIAAAVDLPVAPIAVWSFVFKD